MITLRHSQHRSFLDLVVRWIELVADFSSVDIDAWLVDDIHVRAKKVKQLLEFLGVTSSQNRLS